MSKEEINVLYILKILSLNVIAQNALGIGYIEFQSNETYLLKSMLLLYLRYKE